MKRPIFARLADRKNSRLVTSPASHHGLAKSIISSDFRAVFYRFSLCDNFYPESHSIRRATRFWHDEKITVTKEILNWNVCQVTETESIVVFLQLRHSIHIFTDSLFFLLCLFSFISFCVHWAISRFFSVRFAHSNGRLQSRISLSAYSRWFAFSFGQHKSVGRSLTFRVSAYRWRNTVVTTKVTYCNIVNST